MFLLKKDYYILMRKRLCLLWGTYFCQKYQNDKCDIVFGNVWSNIWMY